MKRNKKVLLILLVLFTGLYFTPLKKAVILPLNENYTSELLPEKNILICTTTATTGPSWVIIGDNTGLFDRSSKSELIILEGNTPEKYLSNTFFINALNNYILIGEFIGEKEYFGQPVEKFRVFKVDEWDIVYPIDRGDSLRVLQPKKAFTLFDFKWL